jgi:hypothetical protein
LVVFETFISCIVLPAGRRRGWEVQGAANIKSFLKQIAVEFFVLFLWTVVIRERERERERETCPRSFLKPS